jgi:hypothetical protein
MVTRMFQPESAERAEMLTGSLDEITAKVIDIFKEMGVV